MIQFFKTFFNGPEPRAAKPLALPLSQDELEKGLYLLRAYMHGLQVFLSAHILEIGSTKHIILSERVSMHIHSDDETYTKYAIAVDETNVLMLMVGPERSFVSGIEVALIGGTSTDDEVFKTGRLPIGAPDLFKQIPREFQIVLTPLLRKLIREHEKEKPKSAASQKLTGLTYSDVA